MRWGTSLKMYDLLHSELRIEMCVSAVPLLVKCGKPTPRKSASKNLEVNGWEPFYITNPRWKLRVGFTA